MNGVEGAEVRVSVRKPSGETFEVETRHTMSADQLRWLRAGSALNYIREVAAAGECSQ